MKRQGPVIPVPRVLFVTGAYAPEFSSGGLQSRAVARALRGRVSVTVLTTATNPSLARTDVVDDVPVTRIFMQARRRAARWKALGHFAVYLAQQLPQVDIVHVQGVSAKNTIVAAMARLHRRPLIVHLQTSVHDEPPAIRAQGMLAWQAFRAAAAFISVSRNLTTAYLESGLPAERIHDVPNATNCGRSWVCRKTSRSCCLSA